MGKQSITSRLREWVGGIAFDIFLWSIRMDSDQYARAIYEQEKAIDGETEGAENAPDR